MRASASSFEARVLNDLGWIWKGDGRLGPGDGDGCCSGDRGNSYTLHVSRVISVKRRKRRERGAVVASVHVVIVTLVVRTVSVSVSVAPVLKIDTEVVVVVAVVVVGLVTVTVAVTVIGTVWVMETLVAVVGVGIDRQEQALEIADEAKRVRYGGMGGARAS